MTKFEVGNRVAVYDNSYRYVGAVEDFCEDGALKVRRDDDVVILVHHKQCRKLVKKEPEYYWVRYCFKESGHDRVLRDPALIGLQQCPNCEVFRAKRVGEK